MLVKFFTRTPYSSGKKLQIFCNRWRQYDGQHFTSIVDFTSDELDRKRFGKKWNRSLNVLVIEATMLLLKPEIENNNIHACQKCCIYGMNRFVYF